MSESQKILRVGIVGAGEVAQVIHLPVLSLLAHLYSVTIVCDLSKKVRRMVNSDTGPPLTLMSRMRSTALQNTTSQRQRQILKKFSKALT